MRFEPITERNEIRKAYDSARRHLQRDSQAFQRSIGWHGGGTEAEVSWLPRLSLWSYFDDKRTPNRYWCIFGLEDPGPQQGMEITGEINMPFEGINRRVAAVFAKDSFGNVYLTHSGKVGGGRRGIGRTAFLNFYRGNDTVALDWPDGPTTQAIPVARIEDPEFASQLTDFVREIDRFKRNAVFGEQDIAPHTPTFKPEFEGQRQEYELSGTVQSQCNHGRVINALCSELSDRGLRVGSDQQRDLFIYDQKGRVGILFEAKTDVVTSSIYAGVGQLMLHGADQNPNPARALVVPNKPNEVTARALARLEIEVLVYAWEDRRPAFNALDEFLSSLA